MRCLQVNQNLILLDKTVVNLNKLFVCVYSNPQSILSSLFRAVKKRNVLCWDEHVKKNIICYNIQLRPSV